MTARALLTRATTEVMHRVISLLSLEVKVCTRDTSERKRDTGNECGSPSLLDSGRTWIYLGMGSEQGLNMTGLSAPSRTIS